MLPQTVQRVFSSCVQEGAVSPSAETPGASVPLPPSLSMYPVLPPSKPPPPLSMPRSNPSTPSTEYENPMC